MGYPPSKSACCRASRISCGLSWIPAVHRAARRLRMPTAPVRPELNSWKISRNAAGKKRGRQQGEPHPSEP